MRVVFGFVFMDERKLLKTISELGGRLPRFPDGRIDYTHSDIAPVVTVFVKCGVEILLLKRGDKVSTYRGKWNTVAGYLDEPKPLSEKVLEELREEVGIGGDAVSSMRFGEPYESSDDAVGKTWLIHPVLVELSRKPEIKLDWEHTECRWIKPDELQKFDVVHNFLKSLEKLI
jgi:8-oxo-dGTP pyrophosphatase MutT (NUDIX family)